MGILWVFWRVLQGVWRVFGKLHLVCCLHIFTTYHHQQYLVCHFHYYSLNVNNSTPSHLLKNTETKWIAKGSLQQKNGKMWKFFPSRGQILFCYAFWWVDTALYFCYNILLAFANLAALDKVLHIQHIGKRENDKSSLTWSNNAQDLWLSHLFVHQCTWNIAKRNINSAAKKAIDHTTFFIS